MPGFQVVQGGHHDGRQTCITRRRLVKESLEPKNTVDAAVPANEATKELSEEQKKALELAERAEHATGRKREALQKQARRKAEDG